MKITADFVIQSDRRFYHGSNIKVEGLELYDRPRGKSLVAVSKLNDYRIKVWVDDNTLSSVTIEVNKQSLQFDRVNPVKHLYQASTTSSGLRGIIKNINQEPKKLSETINTKATEFGNSPVEFARQKASEVYKKEGLSSTYYFYRGAYRNPDTWRNSAKDKLQRRVDEQIDACNEWIAKWTPFVEWWKNPALKCTKERFAEKMGIQDYEQLHPIGAQVRYYPKELYKNAIWPVDWFTRKFEDDINYMKAQIALAEADPLSEIIDAVEELGLRQIPGSSEWEDGFLWFEHPENPGVLFPYNLLWLNNYGSKYDITDTWRVNHHMTSEDKVKTMDQNSAWYHLDMNGIGAPAGHRVGPGWTLSNRLRAYVCGYTKLNVHYKNILWMVKEYAETNSPLPEWDVPGL